MSRKDFDKKRKSESRNAKNKNRVQFRISCPFMADKSVFDASLCKKTNQSWPVKLFLVNVLAFWGKLCYNSQTASSIYGESVQIARKGGERAASDCTPQKYTRTYILKA